LQLRNALQSQIGISIEEDVYLDDEHLKASYGHRKSLARAICESVCMIVVFSPLYQKSDYCLQEFMAMEKIEQKRANKIGQDYVKEYRMIIPIIIKEPPGQDLHPKIKNIKYWNISKHLLIDFALAKIDECKKMIKEIADVIVEYYFKLQHKHIEDCIDCTLPEYEFDTLQKAKLYWEKIQSAPSEPPPPFH
jgi:hypothetical protein